MRTCIKLLTATFLFTLLFSGTISAQTVMQSKLDCPSGHCTSKDLSVVDVFVDVPPCTTCSGGMVTAPLKMTIHNGTKSVRTSFALYGTLSAGATLGGVSGKIFICVGPITVKQGDQTFTVGTITFSCGQELTLSNNFLAWTDASGTTTDRCTTFSNATQCSDIEPKCGTAATITIRQPLSATSSATSSCTTSDNGSVTVTPHGGKAPYDITINGTTTSNVLTATKSPLGDGTYNWSVTDDAGCTTSGTQTVSGVAPPTVFTLTGSAICSSSNTGTVTLSNSQTGVSYQLKNAANADVQSAKAGTGSALTWTSLAAGTYHVVATGAAPTSCTSTTGNADVTIAAPPTVFNLTGSSICASAAGTGTVTLSGSQSGVSYQLKNASNDNNVQSAKSGTGSSLQWTGLAAGSYYVVATGAAPTNCTSQTGNASVTSVANPTVFTLTGSAICGSAPGTGTATLSGSQSGVSYQLKDASTDANVQSAKSGTGSSLQWTGLANGSYYVVATGAAPTSCMSQTDDADVTVNQNPSAPDASIEPVSCSDNTFSVRVKNSVSGLTYTATQPGNASYSSSIAGTGGDIIFTGLTFGKGFSVIASNDASTCTSDATTCGGNSLTSGSQQSSKVQAQTKTSPKVLAAPNPFNDRVKFTLESAVSGRGTLELYNMLGQKVATVFQGFVQKGQVQTIDYSVQKAQRGALIYVFRVGDQRASGKLIGVK